MKFACSAILPKDLYLIDLFKINNEIDQAYSKLTDTYDAQFVKCIFYTDAVTGITELRTSYESVPGLYS